MSSDPVRHDTSRAPREKGPGPILEPISGRQEGKGEGAGDLPGGRSKAAGAGSMGPSGSRRPLNPTVRMRFAAGTCAGRSSGGVIKQNQDSYVCATHLNGWKHVHLFGVYDGHGKQGHFASGLCRTRMPEVVGEELRALPPSSLVHNPSRRLESRTASGEISAVASAFKRACAKVQDEMFEGSKFNAGMSGTTSIMCLFIGRHLVVANSGDSRCVLGRVEARRAEDEGDAAEEGGSVQLRRTPQVSSSALPRTRQVTKWISHPLSTDHEPGHVKERARIESRGGAVRPTRDGRSGLYVGPQRVWNLAAGGHVPGLAMSRSIGDRVATEVGVISDPVVTYHNLSRSRDRSVVLASDGVWQFMSNSEVIETAGEHADPAEAAMAVCREAQDRWIQIMGSQGSPVIDDITALVVKLWPDKAAGKATEGKVGEDAKSAASGASSSRASSRASSEG